MIVAGLRGPKAHWKSGRLMYIAFSDGRRRSTSQSSVSTGTWTPKSCDGHFLFAGNFLDLLLLLLFFFGGAFFAFCVCLCFGMSWLFFSLLVQACAAFVSFALCVCLFCCCYCYIITVDYHYIYIIVYIYILYLFPLKRCALPSPPPSATKSALVLKFFHWLRLPQTLVS